VPEGPLRLPRVRTRLPKRYHCFRFANQRRSPVAVFAVIVPHTNAGALSEAAVHAFSVRLSVPARNRCLLEPRLDISNRKPRAGSRTNRNVQNVLAAEKLMFSEEYIENKARLLLLIVIWKTQAAYILHYRQYCLITRKDQKLMVIGGACRFTAIYDVSNR